LQKDRRRRYKIENFEEILIKSRGVYLTFYTGKKIGVPLCDALIFARESSAAKPRCFPSP